MVARRPKDIARGKWRRQGEPEAVAQAKAFIDAAIRPPVQQNLALPPVALKGKRLAD